MNLGDQIKSYFNETLKARDSKSAPNYDKLPENDSKNKPSHTNYTTNPINLKKLYEKKK